VTDLAVATALSAVAAGTATALLAPSRPSRLRRRDGGRRRKVPRSRAAGRSPNVVARTADLPGPLVLELIAALLDAGSPPSAAATSLGATLRAHGDARGSSLTQFAFGLDHGSLRPGDGGGQPPGNPLIAPLSEALRLAVLSGMPPAELVRRAAQEERRRRAAAQERALRRLEVLLVLPVGLCLLPAFVLLGIAPTVIDLLSGI
jgi:hypothetical protein